MITSLKVYIWDEEIGRLLWDKNRRLPYFEYNPTFIMRGPDISPFVHPINSSGSRMPIYGNKDEKYQNLPAFLADSLPDSWGNQLFEQWRVQSKISNSEVTPLEKLSFIGKRGMGALEYIPEVEKMVSKEKIVLTNLIDLAHRIYQDRENVVIRADESLTIKSLIAVGTSAGGRQPKAIIAINKKSGEIRSGQINNMDGYDYYILKFNDPERSFSELEMTYYEMAKLAGIDMMECRLLEVGGTQHFLTRRFDREDGGKLHTQTLAALSPGCDSYEKLLQVCRKMRLSETVCEEVFRRMVFNIITNNTDDHDKNFSFIMNRKGKWKLSPAYDITFIFNKGGYQPQKSRCLMARGKIIDISRNDVLDFASDNGIRRPNSIINDVINAAKQFRAIALKYNVNEQWLGRVESCINDNLKEWGKLPDSNNHINYIWHNHNISDLRIEQVYKGNYHLLANVDNKEMKFIFRKGTPEFIMITKYGISQLPETLLKKLAEDYLFNKL